MIGATGELSTLIISRTDETAAAENSTHLSAKLDNTFYAEKLAGLRRKIFNIQSKHEQSYQNQTTSCDLIKVDSAEKLWKRPEVIQI